MSQLGFDVDGGGFSIRGERWPEGVRVRPPTPERPWWATEDGERITYASVVAGQAPALAELLAAAHADAVCRIVRRATNARLGEDHARARTLAAAAARLCSEITGLHAQDSWKPLR